MSRRDLKWNGHADAPQRHAANISTSFSMHSPARIATRSPRVTPSLIMRAAARSVRRCRSLNVSDVV